MSSEYKSILHSIFMVSFNGPQTTYFFYTPTSPTPMFQGKVTINFFFVIWSTFVQANTSVSGIQKKSASWRAYRQLPILDIRNLQLKCISWLLICVYYAVKTRLSIQTASRHFTETVIENPNCRSIFRIIMASWSLTLRIQCFATKLFVFLDTREQQRLGSYSGIWSFST